MTLPRGFRSFAVALVWLACAVGVSGCSGSAQGSHGYITGPGTVLTIDPSDREDVPKVAGETLGGSSVDVADHRGEIVVLNIWASWCPPCRAEADDLAEASRRLPDTTFIGIDTNEDDRSAAESFVREHKPPYDSIYDEDGSLMLAFYGMLRPDSLPSTLVLDKEGRIAALVLGPITATTLVGLVHDVESGT
jgi:thiol-disulfide isomerase/thioredoxin